MSCRILLFSVLILAAFPLVPGASAFYVESQSVNIPVVNPGDTVNASAVVYVASGTAFSAYDDLQFVTELDDPVWTYTLIVNDIENVRPAERGKILTIGGYELAYKKQDDVIVRIAVSGNVPATAASGANISLMKIQELDSRSRVITTSVIEISHLVGQPTPAPTPAYGQIAVASDPAGANVYLDNTIRGVTPVTLKVVTNGRHTVLVRLEGYNDYMQEVTVTADAPRVDAVLSARTAATGSPSVTATAPGAGETGAAAQPPSVPATGSLSVTTSPAGALVYIDSQMKGVTPATIPGLPPGTHSIRIVMDGYQDLETTTEITAGTTAEFVTGLSKRKQTPGFGAGIVVAAMALGLLLAVCSREREKR